MQIETQFKCTSYSMAQLIVSALPLIPMNLQTWRHKLKMGLKKQRYIHFNRHVEADQIRTEAADYYRHIIRLPRVFR